MKQSKLTTVMESITPVKAEKYLNHNTTNRTLRVGVAEQYEADMKAGRWTQCTAPIAFFEDGDIADGQHRLWAVIGSGVAQDFLVMRGLPREAAMNIDTGLGRSLVDNGKISGLDTGLSTKLIAVCKAVEMGDKTWGRFSNSERALFVDKHRAAGEWAVKRAPKGATLKGANVLAAIARAWYVEPNKERLAQFCDVLSTGFSEGVDDTAAVALRNYLQGVAGPTGRRAAAADAWQPAFLKCQNAIWYFMRRKALTVIRPTDTERYPLPTGTKSALPKMAASKIGKLVAAKAKEAKSKEK